MQYRSLSVLSIFALTAIAKPLGTVESTPEPAPIFGDAAIAAGDTLEAEHENKKNWEIGGQAGPVYWPFSVAGNTCVVHNKIGINDDQKPALHDCINNNSQLWASTDCQGLTFTVAKDIGHWKNSQECYGANKDCINKSIDAGFGDVVCYTQSSGSFGTDTCKISYTHTVPLPADQVQDPAKDPKLE